MQTRCRSGLLQVYIYCGKWLAGFLDRERGMREKIAAWDAYQAGEMPLPPGYDLEYGADVLLLRRADGSMVAAFSARGVSQSEVTSLAEGDYRTNNRSSA
jgi:hypothetical protein